MNILNTVNTFKYKQITLNFYVVNKKKSENNESVTRLCMCI